MDVLLIGGTGLISTGITRKLIEAYRRSRADLVESFDPPR